MSVEGIHTEPFHEPETPILQPGFAIEAIGLQHQTELPAGYSYTTAAGSVEMAWLFSQHYPGLPFLSSAAWQAGENDEARRGLSAIHIGVREPHFAVLVAVGKLSYREGDGVMSDFLVAGGHRQLGIGRAIINEQVALADLLPLDKIYVPELADSNRLASYYSTVGFQPVSNGGLLRVRPGLLDINE